MMKKYNLKITVNKTRKGRCIKMWKSHQGNPYELAGIQIDGITDPQELRRGLRAQFDFVVDEIVEYFRDELKDAQRVTPIRIKEKEASTVPDTVTEARI